MDKYEKLARRICKKEHLQYLSHEFHWGHCYPLWITVEASDGERFAIKRMLSEGEGI